MKKFLKLLSIVTIIIICALLYAAYEFKFDASNYYEDSEFSGHTIGIIVKKTALGDKEAAERLKIAAEKIGWRAYIFKYKEPLGDYKITAWLTKAMLSMINYVLKPKFIITSVASYHPIIAPDIRKYLIIYTDPSDHLDYIKRNPRAASRYKSIVEYDGYLDISERHEWFEKFIASNYSVNDAQNNKYIATWYPSSYATKYTHLDYNSIFYCGDNWDKLRSSAKYKAVLKNLEVHGLLKIYGPSKKWEGYPLAYQSLIPGDGVSLINEIQKSGIYLVLHSEHHNKQGIPSARIFEGAAASAVMISDENPFVKKHFGDCVYYVDTKKSSEKITSQILNIYQDIRSHPKTASQKAVCAHNIFLSKFTLEQQLKQIPNFK